MKNFRFGLIGNNVAYSKSADIFQAIFQLHEIDGQCEVFNMTPDEFDDKFQAIDSTVVDGLSVTIPYKNRVIPFLDEVAPIANAIGAVNSIRLENGKRIGYNTDCFGFSYPLRKYAEKLKHGDALIFGAGGAAKASLYALYTDYEIKKFTIVARNKEKLSRFTSSLTKDIKGLNIHTKLIGDFNLTDRYTICVNCTPLGGWNYSDAMPFPDNSDMQLVKIYYDLNYNADNICMRYTNTKSHHAIDGSAMLVAQALRSFYLWTGIKTEFAPIYERVFGGK